MKAQIEKLKNDITECYGCDPMYYGTDGAFLAENLVKMGWRKQEWISVEERLPEKGLHVLCLYPQKDYGSKVVVDYAETADGFFAEQYLFGKPSHWMPLPESPKGGAE